MCKSWTDLKVVLLLTALAIRRVSVSSRWQLLLSGSSLTMVSSYRSGSSPLHGSVDNKNMSQDELLKNQVLGTCLDNYRVVLHKHEFLQFHTLTWGWPAAPIDTPAGSIHLLGTKIIQVESRSVCANKGKQSLMNVVGWAETKELHLSSSSLVSQATVCDIWSCSSFSFNHKN